MQVITGPSNPEAILAMYRAVSKGVESEARGRRTRNVRNLAIVLDAAHCPLTSFFARKLNLEYCKKEWLWYLRGDRFDDSIAKHATMWAKLQQPDGSYYSNYGQYIFADPQGKGDRERSQFMYCFNMLRSDVGSRRASMVLLKADHLFPENIDTVCTYAINFCIEDGTLHMTVMMRSNDVIYGFTNDAFCFWNLYQFMYVMLREYVPGLAQGTYTHISNSMHVYEPHFGMIERMVQRGMSEHTPIHVPVITVQEAVDLIISGGDHGAGAYTIWLKHGG